MPRHAKTATADKRVRARIQTDRRLLELPEPVPTSAGGEIYVTLGLPEAPLAPARPRVELPRWPGTVVGRLSREDLYEDIG